MLTVTLSRQCLVQRCSICPITSLNLLPILTDICILPIVVKVIWPLGNKTGIKIQVLNSWFTALATLSLYRQQIQCKRNSVSALVDIRSYPSRELIFKSLHSLWGLIDIPTQGRVNVKSGQRRQQMGPQEDVFANSSAIAMVCSERKAANSPWHLPSLCHSRDKP